MKVTFSQYLNAVRHWGFIELILSFGVLPIAGVAIFAVKNWSLPVFIVCAGTNMLINIVTWHLMPGQFGFWMLIGANSLNILVVVYMLSPEVRVLFLNPKMRWWESKPRYPVKIDAILSGGPLLEKCTIIDISEGGVFVGANKDLKIGQAVKLDWSFQNLNFSIRSRVVYRGKKNSAGYGIRFVKLDGETKQTMGRLITAIKATSVPVEKKVESKIFL